jgi:hypothetical protein
VTNGPETSVEVDVAAMRTNHSDLINIVREIWTLGAVGIGSKSRSGSDSLLLLFASHSAVTLVSGSKLLF